MSSSRYKGTWRELHELGEERRGRPRSNKVKVFFKLNTQINRHLEGLDDIFPNLNATQSELAGLGVEVLGRQLDKMANAIGRKDNILPAGVVDLESLYLIWNLEFPSDYQTRPTTVYLLPGQSVQLGLVRSQLRLQIRVNQSELLNLGLALLWDMVSDSEKQAKVRTIKDLAKVILDYA
jgi:hypothetical protein